MNALLVIGALVTGTFVVAHVANIAWVAFFGYCTYQNVKTTNEIKAELAEITAEDTRKVNMDFVDKVYDLKLLADKYGLILHKMNILKYVYTINDDLCKDKFFVYRFNNEGRPVELWFPKNGIIMKQVILKLKNTSIITVENLKIGMMYF